MMEEEMYKWSYETPNDFSNIIMNSDGEYLTGLWFKGSKDECKHSSGCEEKLVPVFEETVKWLDIYFGGREPKFTPKYKVENLTSFRRKVIDIMNRIPYGETTTYNDIAKEIAREEGKKRMSAQAVGGAVGWNPICIIIPCHRVVGSNGSLTGYEGGIENKISLLKLEKVDMSKFYRPQ